MDDGRASWDDEKDFTWMKEMIHQVHVLGKRANSGFKREAWHAATTKLNSDHAVSYTKEQVEKRRDEEAIRAGFTDYEDVRYWARGGNVPVHLLGWVVGARG
ncbi:hypothetical protein AaE_015765 [Aphanomyces astaci]|uniref:Myb/SANT-like domain-containing protein n=1 Tax=Aphanomyces astaci TaxID=112090 RepID=A0A6A4YV24_APHAT|nr:hypothetical protein AaE_015765 [Aphanomyces astaci]